MSDIWVVSDTHFGHDNILKYENRPFKSVKEMDEAILENWNAVVKPGDKVYHLGDVYMGSGENAWEILKRLNGKKRLVLGNHDDPKAAPIGKFFQKITLFRAFREFGLMLSHVPVHPSSIIRVGEGFVNVHGHIHGKRVMKIKMDGMAPDDRYRCVCVEHTNYTPINIEDLRVK